MSEEDRQRRFPFPLLLAGLALLLLAILLYWRLGGEDPVPPPAETPAAVGSDVVSRLSEEVSRYSDLSAESVRLREEAEAARLARAAALTEPVPETPEFPETVDFATSQPIELAMLLAPGTLSGWVSDSKALPIAGAAVRLEYERAVEGGVEAPELATESNENGTFRIEGIPPGEWTAIAEKSGYATAALAGIEVRSNVTHRPVELRLEPERVLRGIVTAADQPIEGVRIVARRELISTSADGQVRRQRLVYSEATSGADGRFELGSLPLGRLSIRATATGFARWEKDVAVAEENEELAIKLEAGSVIAGEVQGPRGERIAGAELVLSEMDNAEQERARIVSGDDGKFLFQGLLPRKQYDLTADAEQYAAAGPIRVTSGDTTLVVKLGAGGAITGKVTNLVTGMPLASVMVVAFAADSPGTPLRTRTNSEGLYRIGRLRAGTYTVAIASNRWTSEPREGVAVEQEATTEGVDFAVYPGLLIQGTVLDGETRERLANATVEVKSRTGPKLLITRQTTTVTDASGTFEFENMPQGVFTLEARLQGYAPGLGEEAFARVEALRGITPQPVEIPLYRGGVIQGTVTNRNGSPLHGALIQVFHAPQTQGRVDTGKLATTTDMGGEFLIDSIPVQNEVRLYLSAWAPGYAKGRTEPIILNQDQRRRRADITLDTGVLLRVLVRDSNGGGIADADVSVSHRDFGGDPAPEEWSGRTGPDGTHVFSNVPRGAVGISASRTGYISGSTDATLGDEPSQMVEVTLTAANRLTGRVYDDLNQPAGPGTAVAHAMAGAVGGGSAPISADGRFAIESTGEGQFRVELNVNRSTAAGDHTVKWSIPGITTNAAAAEAVLVVPCNASLEGQVIAAEWGEELRAYTVAIDGTYRDDAGVSQRLQKAHTFNAGTPFRFDRLPPGDFDLEVTAPDFLPVKKEGLVLESPGLYSAGTIRLDAGGSCRFRVVNELTGEPIGGVTGALVPDGPSRKTDASGNATIAPISPGVYTLKLSHGDYVPAEQAALMITRGKETDAGIIEMRPGAVITGTVTDGAKRVVSGIEIETTSNLIEQVKRTTTDVGGKYTLRGLHPGGVELSVRGKVNERRVAKTIDVPLAAGEVKELDIELWANSRLTISLIGSANAEVQRSIVNLYPLRPDRTPMLADAVAAEHFGGNRFRAVDLLEGAYLITVSAPVSGDGILTWTELARVSGRDTSVVAASGSMRFSGQILESALGRPVAEQEVRLELLTAPQSGIEALSDWWQFTSITDNNGFFTFSHLPEGTYSLVAINSELGQEILEIIDVTAVAPVPVRTYFFQ